MKVKKNKEMKKVKVTEEVVDVDNLVNAEEFDFDLLVGSVIERDFIASTQQDSVYAVFVKSIYFNDSFKTKLAEVVESWVSRKIEIQTIQEKVNALLNSTSSVNIADLPDDAVRQSLTGLFSRIVYNPGPDEMPEPFRIMTNREISANARHVMVNNFRDRVKPLAEILNKYGVPQEYSPDINIIEIALLSAYFAEALRQQNSGPGLILPNSGLYTP